MGILLCALVMFGSFAMSIMAHLELEPNVYEGEGSMSSPAISYEGLVFGLLYFIYYILYCASKGMQPFVMESYHEAAARPTLPTYTMATPATPVFNPHTSPIAAPPAYYQVTPAKN